MFLKECKYSEKEEKMARYIIDDLLITDETSSDDSDEE